MNAGAGPFLKIHAATGRIVWANMKDRRLWPWIVALVLQHAKGQPNAFMRNRNLNYAERLATIRRTFYGPSGMTNYAAGLINGCELCGAKAAYLRTGFVGRCRKHRDVTSANEAERLAKLEARDGAIEALERARGTTALVRAHGARQARNMKSTAKR